MLSIIVSSYKTDLYASFTKSVEETIGCAYEIIKIDNPGKFSIAEAYNIGIGQAQYDFMLFVHEDVIFHSVGWGAKLADLLKSKDVGIVGLAGTKFYGNIPVGWWDYKYSANRSYMIQGLGKDVQSIFFKKDFDYINGKCDVKIADGFFLGISKKTGLYFNENIKGFHAYDLAICLEAERKNKKVILTNEIVVEHFSKGTLNKEWCIMMHEFHRIYRKQLKKNGDPVTNNALEAYKGLIIGLFDHNYKKEAIFHFIRFFKYKKWDKFNLYFLCKFIFKI